MNGKGDARRPCLVSYTEYANNWKRAFGNKDGEAMAGLNYQINTLKRAIREIDQKLKGDGAVPCAISDGERRRMEVERDGYKKQKERLEAALEGK